MNKLTAFGPLMVFLEGIKMHILLNLWDSHVVASFLENLQQSPWICFPMALYALAIDYVVLASYWWAC